MARFVHKVVSYTKINISYDVLLSIKITSSNPLVRKVLNSTNCKVLGDNI